MHHGLRGDGRPCMYGYPIPTAMRIMYRNLTLYVFMYIKIYLLGMLNKN